MSPQLKKSKYQAVIIGAGRIGAGSDSPRSKEILTHAHAYIKHPRVNLSGFFDINKKAADGAAKKWGTRAYRDFNKMMTAIKPDIVSICTPDQSHYNILLKVAKYKPRLVICEKPVTTSSADTQKIIKLFQKINIPVSTNYFRRFDKAIQKIQQEIAAGKYGNVLCASGIYTKGTLHNGSHMIDLARYLFGEAKKIEAKHAVVDFSNQDKTVGGFLEFEKCPQFHLMVGDERQYSIFELDIILEKRRLRLVHFNFCIYIQKVINDPTYIGHRSLSKPVLKKMSLTKTMLDLIHNVVDHLGQGKPLICDIQDALKTQQVCETLFKNIKKQ